MKLVEAAGAYHREGRYFALDTMAFGDIAYNDRAVCLPEPEPLSAVQNYAEPYGPLTAAMWRQGPAEHGNVVWNHQAPAERWTDRGVAFTPRGFRRRTPPLLSIDAARPPSGGRGSGANGRSAVDCAVAKLAEESAHGLTGFTGTGRAGFGNDEWPEERCRGGAAGGHHGSGRQAQAQNRSARVYPLIALRAE